MTMYEVIVCENGSTFWYFEGNLHRKEGPAVEYCDGEKQWWLRGKRYTENFERLMSPAKKLTIAEIESELGYKIEVIGG